MRTWTWAELESSSCSFITHPESESHISPAHLCILDPALNIWFRIPLIASVKVPGRDWLQAMTQICNWPQNAVKQSSPNTFQLIVSDFRKWSGYAFLLLPFFFFFFHIQCLKCRTCCQALIFVTSSAKHDKMDCPELSEVAAAYIWLIVFLAEVWPFTESEG